MKLGLLAGLLFASISTPFAAADKLVYADFEKVENGRPVSARGGYIGSFTYEENKVRKSVFKGAEGVEPAAPELVRIKADDPNHAMKFEYSLLAPNQYAGVAVEIHGLPDVDGKPQPDDVSSYKYLSLQIYATGIRIVRLEIRTNETGKDTLTQWPMYTLEAKQGLNTYRVPTSGFTQPSWVKDVRIDPKDVLKRLTSIALVAFCDQCNQPQQGMVIVDNIVFEK